MERKGFLPSLVDFGLWDRIRHGQPLSLAGDREGGMSKCKCTCRGTPTARSQEESREDRLARLAVAGIVMDLLGWSAWRATRFADATPRRARRQITRAARWPIRSQAQEAVHSLACREELRQAAEREGKGNSHCAIRVT